MSTIRIHIKRRMTVVAAAALVGPNVTYAEAQPPPAPAPTQQAPAPTQQAPEQATASTYSKEQLDQLTAQVALYPDSLLAQVLMASTYPTQVAEAAKWSKANPGLKGDEAVKRVSSKPWDASVQSLTAFPEVLATMSAKPDWVSSLGDAFLAQPDDVMDSVQRLRQRAQASGNLESGEQQNVVVEQTAPEQTVIKIEPTNPEVVYVPSYNPQTVYGAWPYPAYPPVYVPPPIGYGIGYGIAAGISFGIGIGVTSALWGGFNWGRHDVNINTNRYNNLNVNKISANRSSWRQNNQARINNRQAAARAGRPAGRPAAGARPGGAAPSRARAQQTLQRRAPGAGVTGSAQQRVQGIQRQGGAGQTRQGGGQMNRSFGQQPSGGFQRGSAPSHQGRSAPSHQARSAPSYQGRSAPSYQGRSGFQGRSAPRGYTGGGMRGGGRGGGRR